MIEEYRKEREDTDQKIGELAKQLAVKWEAVGHESRFRLEAAQQLDVLRAEWHRQENRVVIERQKPWAKLELRLEGYGSGYAHKTQTYLLLSVEPLYLLDEIEKDPMIVGALLKLADDSCLGGSERHFGGQISRMAVGKHFTVKVYTD